MRLSEIEPVFCDEIPNEIEEGKLYISDLYEVSVHLCACGCKQKTVMPLGSGEWNYSSSPDKKIVSFNPSIGNFNGENPYHAHYYITNNKIVWC